MENGKFNGGPFGHTLHPPEAEFPQSFPVNGGVLEVTNARASLGYLLACLPGAPLGFDTLMTVAADVIVGRAPKPFYLVIPSISGPPILQAFGVAHLSITTSEGAVGQNEMRFLEHRENAQGLFGTPVATRDFSISQQLNLSPGTNWVYVGLEIRIEVHRWFILPPPPAAEREGFVCVDLRSLSASPQNIHYILEPNGPIRVPKIRMSFCPREVFT